MIGHDQELWTMPGPLEDYIAHFQETDKLSRQVKVALNNLSTQVSQAVQAPRVLLQPSNMPWPTRDELRAMVAEWQAKEAPLIAEYNRLPEDLRKYAPQPGTVGH
jgi:hypothetical protein